MLSGFHFANPWGLLGLLALPAILFIHWYLRRYPELKIAGLHLWASADQIQQAGVRRDRLPITPSLILELLAATLLSLLLAAPILIRQAEMTHYIFVLDDSASMMTRVENRPPKTKATNLRDIAVAKVEERIAKARGNALVSIIRTGHRPTLLAGPKVDWKTAQESLSQWQPQQSLHPFESAWDQALQLANESGQIFFLTDQMPATLGAPDTVAIESVGQPSANLAFASARWLIDPESLKQTLRFRVQNFADEPADAQVVGKSGSNVVFRQPISIPQGGSTPVSLEVGAGLKQLEVTIESSQDFMAVDSHLQLVEPNLRSVRYRIQLPDSHSAVGPIRRFLKDATGVKASKVGDDVDLTFTSLDRLSDEAASENDGDSGGWRFFIGPSNSASNSGKLPPVVGPYVLDRSDRLLDGVQLEGVVWGGRHGLADFDTPLLTVDREVLMAHRSSIGGPVFLADIDLAKSNLSDSPAWPILMSNLVRSCRESLPGLNRWNYRINESIRYPVEATSSENSTPLVLTHDGQSRKLPRAAIVETGPMRRCGRYQLVDGEQTNEFCVNFFDAQESDLRKLGSGSLKSPDLVDRTLAEKNDTTWLWWLLAGGVLAFAFWNWWHLR